MNNNGYTVDQVINIYIYYGNMDNYCKSMKSNNKLLDNTYIEQVLSNMDIDAGNAIYGSVKASYERSLIIDGIRKCLDYGLITNDEVNYYFEKYGLNDSSKQKVR